MAARKTTAGTKPAALKTSKTTAGTIARVQANGSWHCPFCDHANHVDNTEGCNGCGALRDGDTMTPIGPVATVEAVEGEATDGES